MSLKIKNLVNPNFIFKETFVCLENDLFEINNSFDIYSLQFDKTKIFLCGSNHHNRSIIDIFEFIGGKFQKKLSLKNHKEFVIASKYFLNKKTKKEYLVSCDSGSRSNIAIIWNILDENNYEEILQIKNIDSILYPFSLLFNYNNDTDNKCYYIHPSSHTDSEIIKEDSTIFKNIRFTKGKILHYLIWENNKDNKNYVIQCNKDYIYIYNIFDTKINFLRIECDDIIGNNHSAFVIYNKNNTDILGIINEKGRIVFYDLLNDKIISVVKINENNLVNSCQFNDKYFIFLSKNGSFLVFDYDQQKIINKIKSNRLSKVKTIKIFSHDIYGKYLLMGGFMTGILIYKNIETFFL